MSDRDELPDSLEVKHIQKLLNCGRRQAYELVNSGQFHAVRVETKIKVSKKVFFQWYEGQERSS
ncbi:helix-turn-helix domain-containing protein [Paenibacillus gorillae]|uniref:helix-turn-helix domain-containing protein n=1 Tax=Paenibacillus gorillae TaxID=1243662 RepID=UPI0005A69655|nr:helix-turn-helix domain-containing protein [Paenibacillus gorillae]